MHRFFVDDAGFQGEVACLEETDARHARRVLRLRPGEEGSDGWGAALPREILTGQGKGCLPLAGELPSTEPALLITPVSGPAQEKWS